MLGKKKNKELGVSDIKVVRDSIIAPYLTKSDYALLSILALALNGLISVYGIMSLAIPYFKGESSEVSNGFIFLLIISMVSILVTVDAIKRYSLSKYLNSIIKEYVINGKEAVGFKYAFIFTLVFMILLDTLGSWATASKASEMYSQSLVTQSLELQESRANMSLANSQISSYNLTLKAWQTSKTEAKTNCYNKWSGWKAKYKAECVSDWNNDNPMPLSSSIIKSKSVSDISNDKETFLSSILIYILFVIFLLLTMIMQYLTFAKIYEQYTDMGEILTDDEVLSIRRILEERISLVVAHIREKENIIKASEMKKFENEQHSLVANRSLFHSKNEKQIQGLIEKAKMERRGEKAEPKGVNFTTLLDEADKATSTRNTTIIDGIKITSSSVPKHISIQKSEHPTLEIIKEKIIKGVASGEATNSRSSLKDNGLSFNNASFSQSIIELEEDGIIQKLGSRYYVV